MKRSKNRHIAVVGAGFAGLALSWYLLTRGARVTLIDKNAPGSGASGVASGLMHPYVGQRAQRSKKATEAMEMSHQLFAEASLFEKRPIVGSRFLIRKVTAEQMKAFENHCVVYKDVKILSSDTVQIDSGCAVYSQNYIRGLFASCKDKGVEYLSKRISDVNDLKDFDGYALTLGAGALGFPGFEDLSLRGTRGQALVCKWPGSTPLKTPVLGKGHIVPLEDPGLVNVGATYERKSLSEEPNSYEAQEILYPKVRSLIPDVGPLETLSCGAGVRVSKASDPLPWIQKLQGGYGLTALGSRGLLYHAYFAKKVANLLGALS